MPRYVTLLIIAFSLLCLSAPAQSTKQIRRLQGQQAALKKDIANQEQMLRSTKKDVNAQLANLQIINAQIEGQQRYVAGIHTELTGLATTLSGLQHQLQLLENDLEDCKHKYRKAVNYMYRNRTQLSKWQFIFSAKNFRQMYRRMRYMTAFSKYQRAQGRIIAEKQKQVNLKRAEVMGVKVQKDKLLAEGQAETRKLQGQQQERQQVVDGLNQKQKQLQASLAQQRRKANQLNSRIDQLIQAEIAKAEARRKAAEARRKAEAARRAKEEAKRKAEAARRAKEEARRKAEKERAPRAQASRNASKTKNRATNSTNATTRRRVEVDEPETPRRTEPIRYTDAGSADDALSGSFASNKGRLPMPITGSYAITAHYGQYNVQGLSGVQLDNKGINITGHPGAQARAVFKGEVTAVFSFGGTYNVIVRHGSYMSVYCNLRSASVRNGQQVSAGQTLGAVAPDASGNCTLHFQLRRETAKLNPEAWLRR